MAALNDVQQGPAPTVGLAIRTLDAAGALIDDFGKPAVAKDLKAFVAALKKHHDTGISTLIDALSQPPPSGKGTSRPSSPVRTEVVASYVRRLEQALGDDPGFMAVYGQLESDANIQVNELTAIAKVFAQAVVKSRPAALKKILSRHQGLMVSRAKAAATGGRIAG